MRTNVLKSTLALVALLSTTSLFASGKGGGTGVPGVSEIRANSPVVPAGGTAQIQFSLTEPKPIMTGTGRFSLDYSDALFGASVYSTGGDAYGLAAYRNGGVNLTFVSPLITIGTQVDYPIVTLTGHVRADALPGSTYTVPANINLVDPTGAPVQLLAKDGTLTVGGSLYVHNVVPGGGTWPAGTVVRVLGGGFVKGTTVPKTTFRIRSATIVSDSEIDLVLDKATTMDSQRIDVALPDKNKTTVTYYSYLRGVEAVKSGEPLVATTDAIYQRLTYLRVAATQQSAGINQSILTALSIQNPNASAATVKLEAYSPISGTFAETTVTLAFGEKISRELGEFFGQALPVGTTVRATSTLPVQFLGFTADRSTGEAVPFVPASF